MCIPPKESYQKRWRFGIIPEKSFGIVARAISNDTRPSSLLRQTCRSRWKVEENDLLSAIKLLLKERKSVLHLF